VLDIGVLFLYLVPFEKLDSMFSHVFVGVSDFERALRFYQPLMACLGHPQRFCEPSRPWAGWQTSEVQARPLFLIGSPYNQQAYTAGNGQMAAFMVQNRAMVDEVYTLALSLGGSCEGSPGLRPEYHAQYYGAYFRDPEGNKLCVVCHE
jgi:lactoylglutathione lyase